MLPIKTTGKILEERGEDALFNKLLEIFEEHRAKRTMHDFQLARLTVMSWESVTGDNPRMRNALKDYINDLAC